MVVNKNVHKVLMKKAQKGASKNGAKKQVLQIKQAKKLVTKLSPADESRIKFLEDCVVMAMLWSKPSGAIDMADPEKNDKFQSLRTRLSDPSKRGNLLEKLRNKIKPVGSALKLAILKKPGSFGQTEFVVGTTKFGD